MIGMKEALLYLWQLPQNVLGVLLLNVYKPSRVYVMDNGVEIYYSHKIDGGVSLGKYVIVFNGHYRKTLEESLKRNTVRHLAVGHSRQSRLLGWLYPVVIGIPSLIALMMKNPYKMITERWADHIAGIER